MREGRLCSSCQFRVAATLKTMQQILKLPRISCSCERIFADTQSSDTQGSDHKQHALPIAATGRAGLLPLLRALNAWRRLGRRDHKRMRRNPEPVYAHVVAKRVSVQALASIHGITRICGRDGRRCNTDDGADQHQCASHDHLSGTSQKAKSSRGPIRRSLYRRSGTLDVRASYSTVVVNDTLLAKLYFSPTSAE